jgi:hypothetical protein
MVAIYKYELGLKFTGWVAENEEKAKEFLGNKYGYWYKGKFCPSYNEEAFCFKTVEFVEANEANRSTKIFS